MTAIGDFEYQELELGPFEWYTDLGQPEYEVIVSAPEGKRILEHTYRYESRGEGGLLTTIRPWLSDGGRSLVFNFTVNWGTFDTYLLVQLSSARLGTCEN